MNAKASHAALLKDPFFPVVKRRLIDATGMIFYSDKDEDLARIIGHRLGELQLPDCRSFMQRLEDPATARGELDAVVSELTIGETYFFRHREVFDALRDVVIPDILSRNAAARRIRIWSAGCSMGAEPYSVAVLLHQHFATALAGWTVEISGTDINKKFLAVAQRGRYGSWALRTTSDEERGLAFTPHGERHWDLRPEYRSMVDFRYHNLVEDPYPSRLLGLYDCDLILCRNVTIYFAREQLRRVVAGFHASLAEGGWLIPGHAEVDLEVFRAFRTVNVPGAVVYQKTSEAQAAAPAAALPAPPLSPSDAEEAPNWVTEAPPPPRPERPQPQAATADDTVPTAPAGCESPADARRLADDGHWHDALACCDALLEQDPANSALTVLRGILFIELDRHAEAEMAFKRAVFLNRRDPLPHYLLGSLLREEGRQEADKPLSTALRLAEAMPPETVLDEHDGLTAETLANLARMLLDGGNRA